MLTCFDFIANHFIIDRYLQLLINLRMYKPKLKDKLKKVSVLKFILTTKVLNMTFIANWRHFLLKMFYLIKKKIHIRNV